MLKITDILARTRDVDLIAEFAQSLNGVKVLDIGAGWGNRTSYFSRNKSLEVTAVDIIDTRKAEYKNGYHFVLADARALHFDEESFDVVVSFDVIEHIDNDVLFLREAYRVLKKDGIFVIGTPNRDRLSHKFRQILGRKVRYPLRVGPNCVHLKEYKMDSLCELLEKTGFKITKKEYVWFGLIGILLLKRFPAFLNSYAQYLLAFTTKP